MSRSRSDVRNDRSRSAIASLPAARESSTQFAGLNRSPLETDFRPARKSPARATPAQKLLPQLPSLHLKHIVTPKVSAPIAKLDRIKTIGWIFNSIQCCKSCQMFLLHRDRGFD